MICNEELSDPLCDSVNRGLTLVTLCTLYMYMPWRHIWCIFQVSWAALFWSTLTVSVYNAHPNIEYKYCYRINIEFIIIFFIVQLEFNVGRNVVIQVKLDEMVQRNKKTGWERRMRCCLKEDKGKNPNPSGGQWLKKIPIIAILQVDNS